MQTRRLVWTATGVLLAAAAAGGPIAAEQVTLRVAMADTKTPQKELEAMFAEFEKQHPDIVLQVEPIYGEDISKLSVQATGGAAADIIEGYNAMPVEAARQGLFLDLSPYIKRDNLQGLLGDFVPGILSLMTIDGHLYGLPQYSAVGVMWTNTEMFANAGLGAPDPNWDWNAFAATVKKLTIIDASGKVKQNGYDLDPGWIWEFPWLAESGVQFDAYKTGLDSTEAAGALTFLQGLVQQNQMVHGWSGIPNRTSAMNNSGSWELKYWADQKLKLGAGSMPIGPTGKRITLTNDDLIAINAATKHPNEAWEFLKWLYSVPVQTEYLNRFGLQPARLSLGLRWVDSIKQYLTDKNEFQIQNVETFINDSLYATPQPFFADATVTARIIDPAIAKILQKNAPVAATLAAAAKQADAVLAELKQG